MARFLRLLPALLLGSLLSGGSLSVSIAQDGIAADDPRLQAKTAG